MQKARFQLHPPRVVLAIYTRCIPKEYWQIACWWDPATGTQTPTYRATIGKRRWQTRKPPASIARPIYGLQTGTCVIAEGPAHKVIHWFGSSAATAAAHQWISSCLRSKSMGNPSSTTSLAVLFCHLFMYIPCYMLCCRYFFNCITVFLY